MLLAYAENDNPTLNEAKALKPLEVPALLALVDYLKQQHSGAHLALLKDAGLPKKARKAAGKAVHLLESRGISCAVTDQRSGSLGIEVEQLPSYMTIPTGDGLTVTLLSNISMGRPECAFVVYNDTGLLEASLIDMPSRSRLRKIMRDIVTDPENPSQTTWVECIPELVRARILEAAALTRATKEPLPDGFSAISSLLEGPTLQAEHPILEAYDAVDTELVQRSLELLADPTSDDHDTVPGPLFEEDWFQALESALEAASENPEFTTEDERRSGIYDVLQSAVGEYFTQERRLSAATRLLDSAYLLDRLDQRTISQITIATALALQDTTIDALDIPWCKQSITRLIDMDAFMHHLNQKAAGAHSDKVTENTDDVAEETPEESITNEE
jgi:hypothetical protein